MYPAPPSSVSSPRLRAELDQNTNWEKTEQFEQPLTQRKYSSKTFNSEFYLSQFRSSKLALFILQFLLSTVSWVWISKIPVEMVEAAELCFPKFERTVTLETLKLGRDHYLSLISSKPKLDKLTLEWNSPFSRYWYIGDYDRGDGFCVRSFSLEPSVQGLEGSQ